MNFLDGSLFPENQDKLVITAAPYGPEWIPSDFPEDIPVSMKTNLRELVAVGWKPIVLMIGETVFLAALVLLLLRVAH